MNDMKIKKLIWISMGVLLAANVESAHAARNEVTRELTAVKKMKAAKPKARPTVNKRGKTVGELLRTIEAKKGQVNLAKPQSALPTFTPSTPASADTPKSMSAVTPPRSLKTFKTDNPDEARLEKVIDQEINELFKLTKKYSNSPNRGELWLRLAELYVEKSRLIEFRAQNEFDKKLADWEKRGRTGAKPLLDAKLAMEFNRKAIQLYEWFAKDFSTDRRMDQALFFLGYNFFELNDVKKGEAYYKELTEKYPKSPFVAESHFALGEYYFENEKWADALKHYTEVIKFRESRVRNFAAYKSAWCQYRLGKVSLAMKTLEGVIRAGQIAEERQGITGRNVGRIRLGNEALRDLVPFYSEVGDYQGAKEYFAKFANDEQLPVMLERLAYIYADTGRRKSSAEIFRELLEMNPTSGKAFDYQLQIVNNYSASGEMKTFKDELFRWIEEYGPEGAWAAANKQNAELLKKADETREKTLRNYVLQLHQTAQNTKAPTAQKSAKEGYIVYLRNFPRSLFSAEMHFYFGELLFDMKEFEGAGTEYLWVVENAPKSKHHQDALLNSVIAIEKSLPSEEQVRKNTGESLEPIAFGPNEERFQVAANRYADTYPNGDRAVDVRFKLGRLHYVYNHFDEALKIFDWIVKKHPKTKPAIYAANLILDIYNLRKDYEGLARAGTELLKTPGFSAGDLNIDVQAVVEKASFKKGQDLETAKDYPGAGKAFEKFTANNPRSKLVTSAYFNSAVNYERGGLYGNAIRMYEAVLRSGDKEADKLRSKSRQNLAALFEKTGQYERAATEYEKIASENPKDPLASNLYFNAAVIWDGLRKTQRAIRDYEMYYQVNRKSSKSEALYRIGEIQERNQKWLTASKYYERYLEDSPRDPLKVIESHHRLAKMYKRMGKIDDATKEFQRTVAIQRRLAGKSEGVGNKFGAEARFELAMIKFNEFKAIRLPRNPEKQQKALKEKLALLTRLNPEFAEVIKYDDSEFVIASLTTLGQAYEHLTSSVTQLPPPAGLPADKTKEYFDGVEQFISPFRQKAIDNYRSALAKSQEFESYGPFVTSATEGVRRLAGESSLVDTHETIPVQAYDFMGI